MDGNGRAELSFGAMISPLAELRQKMLVRGNDRGLVAHHGDRRSHDAADASRGLGQRRLPADPASRIWTRSAGSIERFFMYAEDVDLCAAVRHTAGRCSSPPSRRSCTCAGDRPRRRPTESDGLSPQPDRLLRQAPPRVGAVSRRLTSRSSDDCPIHPTRWTPPQLWRGIARPVAAACRATSTRAGAGSSRQTCRRWTASRRRTQRASTHRTPTHCCCSQADS